MGNSLLKITNHNNLPSPLVVAAGIDEYNRGASDISVTELINSPRFRLMKPLYSDVVEKDVSDMMWPMLGTAFHNLMEKGSDEHDAVREERLFAQVKGWTISGQIDRAEEVSAEQPVIRDYKVTSVFTVKNPRAEWTDQLNCYGWLFFNKYGKWPRLEVIALCRDWRPNEARHTGGPDYPKTPVIAVPIKGMGAVDAERYITNRVEVHQEAQAVFDKTGELAECTFEDRWSEPEKYAVMMQGKKRAVKLHGVLSDAQEHAKHINSAPVSSKTRAYVERREGGERRCEGYCEFAPYCTQYKSIKQMRAVNRVMDAALGINGN